jgi:cobalt-zinc-cadmium efflux system protein
MIVGLVTVGFTAHSLGLISAAGDYVADALSIGLSIATVRLSRRAPTARRSFGYGRSTVLAALLNAALVVATCGAVVVVAIQRLFGVTPHVHGTPVIVVSCVAALAMIVGALILRGDDDLNVRAVLLDTVADAATALGVAVVGVIILSSHGTYWLDPAVALAVSLVIGYRAIGLVREVADVLMESTPPGVDVNAIEAAFREEGDVLDVHDLHVWGLSADSRLLSAHLVLAGHPSLEQAQLIVERAKATIATRFGVAHATLETECEPCASPDPHA